MEFFRNLLEAEPITFDFKWLRGVHKDLTLELMLTMCTWGADMRIVAGTAGTPEEPP